MKISSPVFRQGEAMPVPNTCLGANVNPPLAFEDVPADAKTLVLIFEDADATPKPWTHWMLFNIPAGCKEISENSIPEGATEGLANNHSFGYEGPCPKYFKGTHNYWFRLYALDMVLDLPATSEREDIELAMQPHVIATASLHVLCTAHEQALVSE